MKWPELPIFISAERMDIHMIWGLLSLPLETIALAAARALGIMPDASNAPEDVARGNKGRS